MMGRSGNAGVVDRHRKTVFFRFVPLLQLLNLSDFFACSDTQACAMEICKKVTARWFVWTVHLSALASSSSSSSSSKSNETEAPEPILLRRSSRFFVVKKTEWEGTRKKPKRKQFPVIRPPIRLG